jgi:hypothetical protein
MAHGEVVTLQDPHPTWSLEVDGALHHIVEVTAKTDYAGAWRRLRELANGGPFDDPPPPLSARLNHCDTAKAS